MSSSSLHLAFTHGRFIVGKWYKNRYQVVRELGSGANGQVFLVQANEQLYALKISEQANELAMEYQILQDVNTRCSPDQQIGPRVFELDDWEDGGQRRYFFVMEYVQGIPLSNFVFERGVYWIPVLVSQILRNIQVLNEKGYAFGDLKTENCLVHPHTGNVRLIDFGGVTPFGKGIRQYTEWYDRAWWEQGSRRADASYDMFAITMIVIQLLLPHVHKKIEPIMHQSQPHQLWAYIQKSVDTCRKQDENISLWVPLLFKVWRSEYKSLLEFRNDVMECLKLGAVRTGSKTKLASKRKRKRDWTDYWVWIMVVGSFTLFLFFYFYGP